MSAQNNNVKGIWILKIGQATIDVTNQVATEQHTSIKLAKTQGDLFVGDKEAIFELERNTDGAENRPFRAPYCEGLRVFYISKYIVAGKITLRDFYLTFKNGILIQIFSEQPESFVPTFSGVHGQGIFSAKTDSTVCTCYDKKVTMLNVKYIVRWDDSEQIRAVSVKDYYYDNGCQRKEEYFFQVYATKELSEAIVCENQMRAEISASKKNTEVKKLKDLDF